MLLDVFSHSGYRGTKREIKESFGEEERTVMEDKQ
jgi:hypothetical protein